MKRFVAILLFSVVVPEIARSSPDSDGAVEQQVEQLDASHLLRALGGTYFRIKMPAEVSDEATACLMHRLPGGAVKQLASLSDIKPNQILTLVFIKTGQKKPYFSLSHATSATTNAIEIDTPFVGYAPSSKVYFSGDGLVTFNYIEGIGEGGKATTTTSTLFVLLQNDKGEPGGADQPASAPEPKSEDDSKPKPESEARPQ